MFRTKFFFVADEWSEEDEAAAAATVDADADADAVAVATEGDEAAEEESGKEAFVKTAGVVDWLFAMEVGVLNPDLRRSSMNLFPVRVRIWNCRTKLTFPKILDGKGFFADVFFSA